MTEQPEALRLADAPRWFSNAELSAAIKQAEGECECQEITLR